MNAEMVVEGLIKKSFKVAGVLERYKGSFNIISSLKFGYKVTNRNTVFIG